MNIVILCVTCVTSEGRKNDKKVSIYAGVGRWDTFWDIHPLYKSVYI